MMATTIAKILLDLICVALLFCYCEAAKQDFLRENPGDSDVGEVVFWLGIAALAWLALT